MSGWLIPGRVIQDFPCSVALVVIAAPVPPLMWDQTQLNTSSLSSQTGKISSDGIFQSLGKIRSKTSMSRHWKLFQSCTCFWKLFCPLSLPASSLEWRTVCACFLKRYNLLMRFECKDNWLLACQALGLYLGVFNDTCLSDGSREKRYLDLSV